MLALPETHHIILGYLDSFSIKIGGGKHLISTLHGVL